jgi:hypothetical protein
MNVPLPTPIYRFLHVDNLEVCLRRRELFAPNHMPDDGLPYRTIHNLDIQQRRKVTRIPCGPGGSLHDYVAFYFGPRSPMLLQLHTGRVAGYTGTQEPLIYLVSSAQAVRDSNAGFVFSDGHGVATFTTWFDDLAGLNKVDWEAVYARVWRDTMEDMDRQRRKQAEFLIYQRCPWVLIQEVAVASETMRMKVEGILARHDAGLRRPVGVRKDWYY